MVLASGICPTCELEAAGSPLGLGVDGSASNDSSNMMEAIRHALMIGVCVRADQVTHLDVLRWATQGSARCLGRSDIGRIAEGYEADLALFRLDEPRFSGAHDPLAALVLCGAHRADRVMIARRLAGDRRAPVGSISRRLIANTRGGAGFRLTGATTHFRSIIRPPDHVFLTSDGSSSLRWGADGPDDPFAASPSSVLHRLDLGGMPECAHRWGLIHHCRR